MSFDGLFTYAMTNELSDILTGGRIIKIYQPYQNEIILQIRSQGINHKLLISAHPSFARVQLTKEQYEYPQEPPMFCMLLRKHLEGYFIESIYQHELDRMIIFHIRGRNEIGDLSYKKLIVEIMGRHSNIVLVDTEKQLIIDSVKHVSYVVNRYRAILPGQLYILPPEQQKQSPFHRTEDDILRVLDFNSGKLDKQLVANFAGISPLFAKEILHKAQIPYQVTLPKTFIEIMELIHSRHYRPSIVRNEQKEHFYLLSLSHVSGDVLTFSTLSEMLDHFYFGKAERDRVKQVAGDLEKFIRNELEKNEKKLMKLAESLEEAKNAGTYQLYGELLTANMYAIQKGMTEIEVANYYENNELITISLNPNKTPSENAQQYFSKYQKAKTAVQMIEKQIEKTREEIQYFETLKQQVETASPKDIEEMKTELAEQGYIRSRQKRNLKRKVQTKPQLEKFISSDGTDILVGKNNIQNDYLTMKIASKEDIWLHTKDIPGSHVVIRAASPSEQTILEAANIAAFFSKARESSSVPVDYTKIKHVRKPSGAKPGFVIFDNQKTVYVTPNVELVKKLKA